MKTRLLACGCALSLILLLYSAWQLVRTEVVVTHRAVCQARLELVHGDVRLQANYDFNFTRSKGVVRVEGFMIRSGQRFRLSRQIHFDYQRTAKDFTLTSTQVEVFSSDRGQQGQVEEHWPTFFIQPGRQLTFNVQIDRYGRTVASLGDNPIFYCSQQP